MQNLFSDAMPGGGGGNQAPGPNDDIPWWMKYAGKGAGVVGGLGKISNLNLFCQCHFKKANPFFDRNAVSKDCGCFMRLKTRLNFDLGLKI